MLSCFLQLQARWSISIHLCTVLTVLQCLSKMMNLLYRVSYDSYTAQAHIQSKIHCSCHRLQKLQAPLCQYLVAPSKIHMIFVYFCIHRLMRLYLKEVSDLQMANSISLWLFVINLTMLIHHSFRAILESIHPIYPF